MAASIVKMQALLLGTETIEDFLAELAGLAEGAGGQPPLPPLRPAPLTRPDCGPVRQMSELSVILRQLIVKLGMSGCR
jgi:hypothetical protein